MISHIYITFSSDDKHKVYALTQDVDSVNDHEKRKLIFKRASKVKYICSILEKK